MGPQLLAVLRKELVDAVRDRRAFASGLLYGIWGPLVMAMALAAVATSRTPEGPITVAVQGAGAAPGLVAFLASRAVTVEPAPADPAGAVRDGTRPVVLAIDETYAGRFAAARPARVVVYFDQSRGRSVRQAERLRGLLAEYGRRVADTRLVLRGIAPAVAAPLDVEPRDVSTPARRAATLVGALPIFLLLAAFVGGMGLAADATAGERERGSLEALVAQPVRPLTLVLGKWAATAVLAVATLSLTLAAAALVLEHPQIQALDVPVGLSWRDAATVWALLVPMALLAAAVQVRLGLGARTYKEAHTQLSLLMFVPMLPGFLLAFGSIPEHGWMAATPILGQHLAVSGVLRGESPAGVAMLALTTLAGAAAALAAASRLGGRESLLRRSGT